MDKTRERAIDRMLEQIGAAVDALDHDEVDVEIGPGKLTIACAYAKLILSRQPATGQIWLAEPHGGWHFDLRGEEWICDKRGVELVAELERLMGDVLGQGVTLGR
jgi:CyaY protein